MEQALEYLEFKCMDEVTPESLKRAFKEAAMKSHPDRGGDDFDQVLSSYLYLSNVLKRMTGGRDGLPVLHVDDVKQAREEQFLQELNNMVNEVIDQLDHKTNSAFLTEFNEQFERLHVRDEERGYGEWLRMEEDVSVPASIEPDQFQSMFESIVGHGKPATSLILHPDEMATISGKTHGTALIQSSGQAYTSEPDTHPEYTDLHDAYTSENTLFDKLPVYQEKQRTFEDLLQERDMVYTTEHDRDLEAIAAYEKRKMEEEKEHERNVAAYFKRAAPSQWALRGVITKNGDSFVKQI